MADYGSKVADKAINAVERQLRSTYKQAAKELTEKLNQFLKKHEAKDKVMKQKRADGVISQQDYANWQTGQLFMEKAWKDKIDQCTKIMFNANSEAAKIVHEKKLDVFAENYNYQAFQLSKQVGTDMGFNLYNTQSVAKLVKDKPDVLPKWKIDQKKDYIWNYKKVNNSIKQGIIQGEGIDKITDRLVKNLCTQNEDKMRTFARTAITGAQNSGRMEQMHDAEDAGVKVKKRWVATLDDRTRDLHAELDGQEVPIDEPFKVGGYEIDYPGDPSADPEMVYNCRCTMIEVYEGIDRSSVRRDQDDNEVRDMTYNEWKEAKENGTLNTEKKLVEPPIGSEQKVPDVQVPEATFDDMSALKQKIADHQGDWTMDDLVSSGDDFAAVIDQDMEVKQKEIDDLKNKAAEWEAKQDKLIEEYNAAYNREDYDLAEKILRESQAASEKKWEFKDKAIELENKMGDAASEAVRQRLSEIRDMGGVTKDNVETVADLKAYRYKAKQLKEKTIEAMNHYPTQWLEKSALHSSTLKPHWTTGRACYGWGEILFSDRKATNIHELGHRFEHVIPAIKKAEKEFYERRTAGETLQWLGRGYARSEVTRKDHFIYPYMGKDYHGVAYELVSMGFQMIFTDYNRFKREDPEMLKWCLGLLAGI